MNNVLSINDSNFVAEVLDADRPVLVDFFATWCPPCKRLTPEIEKVAARLHEVKFVKIDTDASPLVASKLGVRGLPTLVLFHKGQAVSHQVGFMPAPALESWLRESIGRPAA